MPKKQQYQSTKNKTLGLIVNPIAGIAGKYAFKGSDDPKLVQRAIELGAKPVSPGRAKEALSVLKPVKDVLRLLTFPSIMGEDVAREIEFKPEVIGELNSLKTTSEDTKKAARMMVEMGVELILYAGGDGTTVDILEAVDQKTPILGIPSGVKIWSATFATSPKDAGFLTLRYLWEELPVREAEVMDVDEESFRKNVLNVELKGYAITPYEPQYLQGSKGMSPSTADEIEDQKAIARSVAENLESNTVYIIGPGTTCKSITDLLGLNKTLLGVDLVQDREILVEDADEQKILKNIENKKSKIIVTPIGRQGFIFGRGNQQISSEVINKVGIENIMVIATPYKLSTIPILRVDTNSSEIDEKLGGYIRVITGYHQITIKKIK
ncbi:MAG: ATP-NAD kinase family protein [Candidatus Jordarchaeum sp.]|uniref:ATP-NAD kinase family protein n=1 Tax=Candidatus Jordarchaeum sp. TaxID=2823881 RepID=UPI00404AE90C